MPFNPDDGITTDLIRNNVPLPLVPKINPREKTWFLERQSDGEVLAMDESSAWHALQPSDIVKIPKPVMRIIGVMTAEQYLNDMKVCTKIVDPEERTIAMRKAFADAVQRARDSGNREYPFNPNIRNEHGDIQRDPRVLAEISNRR